MLVVGLGGGAAAGAASRFPELRVTVVELSEWMVEAAPWFTKINHDVIHQEQVTIRIDDGRNHLLLTDKRYDVITADAIQPYYAGAGNLYSAEYFALGRRALADDGLALQWVGGDFEEQRRLIVRTFLSVYPEATLWMGDLLIGSKRPLVLSRAALDRTMAEPTTRDLFRELGIESVDELLATYTAGPRELTDYAGSGVLLTDDRPLTEYFLQLGGARGAETRLNTMRPGTPPPVVP